MSEPNPSGSGSEGHARPVLLVVDDAPLVLRSAARALESSGLSVVKASTVREARAALARCSLDAALVDLELGSDSGVSLLREVRATLPRLPLALMSAHELREVTNAASSIDASLYVKPFHVVALAPLLRRAREHMLDRLGPLDLLPRAANLTDRERRCLEEHLFHHRSYEDVARELGISRHTAKSYAHRALTKLAIGSAADVRIEIRARRDALFGEASPRSHVDLSWEARTRRPEVARGGERQNTIAPSPPTWKSEVSPSSE
jgi:DNA-binding NarL/FixJ family response regulator